MSRMMNQTQDKQIIDDLTIANSFRVRAQGLIGTKSLRMDQGVWFPKTNWIHTFFMSMPIDVIYLDKKMKVHKLQPALKPWRMPAPVFWASSVLETQAGFIEQHDLKVGDTLYVGH